MMLVLADLAGKPGLGYHLRPITGVIQFSLILSHARSNSPIR
jgi:hypothetical protein